jgi:hypothetical protein
MAEDRFGDTHHVARALGVVDMKMFLKLVPKEQMKALEVRQVICPVVSVLFDYVEFVRTGKELGVVDICNLRSGNMNVVKQRRCVNKNFIVVVLCRSTKRIL